jgi:hypothetical protein
MNVDHRETGREKVSEKYSAAYVGSYHNGHSITTVKHTPRGKKKEKKRKEKTAPACDRDGNANACKAVRLFFSPPVATANFRFCSRCHSDLCFFEVSFLVRFSAVPVVRVRCGSKDLSG